MFLSNPKNKNNIFIKWIGKLFINNSNYKIIKQKLILI